MDSLYERDRQTAQRIQIFETFFRDSPVAMLLIDSDRRVRELNRAAEALLQTPEEEAKGQRFGELVCCAESNNSFGGCGFGLKCVNCQVRQVVEKTIETGRKHTQVEAKLRICRTEQIEERYVLVSAAVSALENERLALVCIEDITERKRAELNLKQALEEVERLKDRLQQENLYLREEFHYSHGFEEIVGQSETLRRVIEQAKQVARTDANVLLLGETGTGKELFARAIHNSSSRKDQPLVKVNCAALPSSLIESELFGHVKGAFTGALTDKIGRFELADGGTIFLDEIGELDPSLQAKLLQVLQEGTFERIGSSETKKVNVRVVAATNRDLEAAMEDGSFRPDLYFRLAVFPIRIPPLRERREDIPLLVWHFISRRQAMLGKQFTDISDEAMQALLEYEWPGNIRELENVIERAMILSPGPVLELEGAFTTSVSAKQASTGQRERVSSSSSVSLEELDRAHILSVLEECNWKIKGPGNAAERLGLKPSTLRYRMKKLGIRRPPQQPR